ncbi:MAG: DUF4412 domain-containing protein [Desulfobacter sp.]|nr:MAG: DUF4412 domain-containing protein [Desulfobacter sp.]
MKTYPKGGTWCPILITAVIFLFLFIIAESAFALFGGKVDNFTADQVELSKEGKVVNTIKFYVTPKATRMDGMPGAGMNPHMPAANLSMFSFNDKNEYYIFNHDKKLYYKTTQEDEDFFKGMGDFNNAQQVKELGTEKVSGYKCTKKEITMTSEIYGMKNTTKTLIWQSDKFDMPLRVQSEQGHTSEMRHIKKGAPADSVFILPKGYKKVQNIMAAMGMDFGDRNRDDDKPPVQASQAASQQQGQTGQNSQVQTGTPGQAGEEGFINKENIEKTLQGLGKKLKGFKFGQD